MKRLRTANRGTRITKTPAHTLTHALQNKTKQTQYKIHSKYKYTYNQTPAHTLTHAQQNKLKQPQYKARNKQNSHNTIKNPQLNVTIMYRVLSFPRTLPYLQNVPTTSLSHHVLVELEFNVV
jgi:hypothetical protein